MRLALAAVALLIAAGPACADTIYAGSSEHHRPSVAIVVHRGDVKKWAAQSEQVDAFCFYHAANVAHVDGHWWAINGISRGGIGRRWIEDVTRSVSDIERATELQSLVEWAIEALSPVHSAIGACRSMNG